jgi:hypothetical protein
MNRWPALLCATEVRTGGTLTSWSYFCLSCPVQYLAGEGEQMCPQVDSLA